MTPTEYRDRYIAVTGIPEAEVPPDIAGAADHTLHSGILEYDAPNRYGALIRHSAACDLDTSDPRDFDIDSARHNVQVNGLSRVAWILDGGLASKFGAPPPRR